MITAWRIVQTKYLSTAFDGEGARNYPGRWNTRGTPMIYTAGSLALAALEMLAHLESAELLSLYTQIPVTFAESLCLHVKKKDLPESWADDPAPVETRQIGTDWANGKKSAVLIVPSAIISAEFNFLVNPLHPDFRKIKTGRPEEFRFDSRIIKKMESPGT